MKRVRTWQLCRTGKFGADGATITKKDLEEIVETFTPPRPISIGHDAAKADNFPKFGDVLYLDGIHDDPKHPGEKVLVAGVVLHPELEKQFDDKADGNGIYEGWSVTIPRRASDGKRYLHSLAICGATPPKIPELEQLMVKSCFSDNDTVEVYDFSDSVEYQEESSMTEEEKKKMADLEAENKKLKDAQKASEDKKKSDDEKSKQDYADMAARCEALEKGIRDEKVKALTDKFSDKVSAAVLPKIKAVAEALSVAGECEFSDGSETKKQAALDAFADVLSGIATVTANKEILDDQFDAGEYSDKAKKGGEEKGNPADIAARM